MTVEFIDRVGGRNVNLWTYLAYKGIKLSSMDDKERQSKKCELIENIVDWSKDSFNQSKIKILDLLNETKTALKNIGYEVRDVEVELESKGLFGASSSFGKLIFEVGLFLDPILNVPCIPSSSLKGAIRVSYYVLSQQKRKYSEKDAEKECDRLFGSRSVGEGLVGFTDAYPVQAGRNGYILYPDVITPHYKDVDTELNVNPIPISFLTVAPETHFRFFIFWKDLGKRKVDTKDISRKPEPKEESLGLLDLAVLLALKTGVGAKITLGYSTFEVVKYE
ncbi:MAG: type III-B CRISPR module RAMP protein Cmr6 [Candidatus Bathyarchaeia archaeon]